MHACDTHTEHITHLASWVQDMATNAAVIPNPNALSIAIGQLSWKYI